MTSEEKPKTRPMPRSESGIGCWGPPKEGTTDLEEPGMTVADDGSVINWNGENYYRACGTFVSRIGDGDMSTCVKRENHPGHIHEDFEGRTKDDWDFGFGVLSLEEAVGQALGAASVCWDDVLHAGTFQSTRCAEIAKQLMARIRQAGPIFE